MFAVGGQTQMRGDFIGGVPARMFRHLRANGKLFPAGPRHIGEFSIFAPHVRAGTLLA
jgi:hypothetical protein